MNLILKILKQRKADDIFRTIVPLNCNEEEKAQDKVEKAQDKAKKAQDKAKKAQDNIKNIIIDFCKEEKNIFEIMNYLGYKNRTRFTRDYITPMVEKGLLLMTIPDKPTSRNQKYISKKQFKK